MGGWFCPRIIIKLGKNEKNNNNIAICSTDLKCEVNFFHGWSLIDYYVPDNMPHMLSKQCIFLKLRKPVIIVECNGHRKFLREAAFDLDLDE